jgi:radical SAM superfamily enzyme YgiQ (UPF0313 family)
VVELRQFLERDEPAVVGIGATSHAFYWALELARAVKLWRKECIVILGGPHEDEAGGSGPGGSILDHSDVIDFSVQGDGEYLLAELFDVLHKFGFDAAVAKRVLLGSDAFRNMQGSGAVSFLLEERVQGVSLGRHRPGLRRSGVVPLDLDSLPPPPRWLLAPEHEYLFDVFNTDERPKRTAQVMMTRGCKYACTFCTEAGALAHRSVHSVMDEISLLAREGYEAAFFDDSTFHLYPAIVELLSELGHARNELNMEFGCLTRVDALLDHLPHLPLGRFADAGFTYFYLGIEHDDDKVLGEIHKGYDSAKLHACLDLFRNTDQFRLGVSLLFGLRSESDASIRRTLRLVTAHPAIVIVNLSAVALHPGAMLARRSKNPVKCDVLPPNREPEWDLFEEGRWFHPEYIGVEYARKLHRLVREIDGETNGRLIAKLRRGANVLGPRVQGQAGSVMSSKPAPSGPRRVEVAVPRSKVNGNRA